MIKTKMAFLEGRLLSSQSKQSEKFSKRPAIQKSHFCFDHVNRLRVSNAISAFLLENNLLAGDN